MEAEEEVKNQGRPPSCRIAEAGTDQACIEVQAMAPSDLLDNRKKGGEVRISPPQAVVHME